MTANDINKQECQDAIWECFRKRYTQMCDHIREAVYDGEHQYASRLFAGICATASTKYSTLLKKYSNSFSGEIKPELDKFIRKKLRNRYQNRGKTHFGLDALEDMSIILNVNMQTIAGLPEEDFDSTNAISIYDTRTINRDGLQSVYYCSEDEIEKLRENIDSLVLPKSDHITVPCMMLPFLGISVVADIYVKSQYRRSTDVRQVSYNMFCWQEHCEEVCGEEAYRIIEGYFFDAAQSQADTIDLQRYAHIPFLSAQIKDFFQLEYRVSDGQGGYRESVLNSLPNRNSHITRIDRDLDE